MPRRTIYDQRPPAPKGIIVLGDETPTFPEEFQRRLQQFDKDLLITWHRPPHWPRHRRGVWKIEMCVAHHGDFYPDGRPKHSHICDRRYVLMCQDADGTAMPLGDWIFAKLGEMRSNVERLGGATARGLQNFREESARIDQEMAAKREADSQDVKVHNRKDHRVQLNKLRMLVERHDMRPNR